ncbi:hypothetical protein ABEV41_00745 [Geobacillus thermodenitrificans]|jgi:glutathionyl-hydroquinone reductase|uniref:hypothetical protein n=1 Tax=Geobacillus thermodenitrificans TaxID=33940 RepID=UPI003D2017FB
MDFVVEKIEKAMKNLQRALDDVNNGNRRIAISHLDFAKENAQEAIYLILAELEEVGKNG